MNGKLALIVAVALMGAVFSSPARAAEMSEKEKALANPYPNDFGPATLPDDVIKAYPANVQAGYKKLLSTKSGCAQCHSSARPLNSRFVEPEGGMDDAKQDAWLAQAKKDQPSLFADGTAWQVETKVWSRYVKRMMNKPGCNLQKADGKDIYTFLQYDSVKRKTGANAAKWAAHRKDLVDQLKAKNPKRYDELKEAKDL
jgi:mono/diheme cytochrome c family protein